MSPALAEAIAAATDLAWRSTSNLPGSVRYHERRESHAALVRAIARVRTPRGAPAELRYLIAAMRRVAACSFANRMGQPYYARKRAVAELRGCLEVYRRS